MLFAQQVYATQDGALVGGRGDFPFPQSSGNSFASGSTEGEEVRDQFRWHSESSESTDSKFLKVGPAEAAVQDANEKVRKWRGEHFPLPNELHDLPGVAQGSILEDEPQQAVEVESPTEVVIEPLLSKEEEHLEGASLKDQSRGEEGFRVSRDRASSSAGAETAAASEEFPRSGGGPESPVLDRRKDSGGEDHARTFGSFTERHAVVEDAAGGANDRKEARLDKGGAERDRRDAKLEKKGSWKKKASALFRSDTIQRIRQHRQQEKAKAQQESVAEEESVPDPGRPVIREISADGRVELGPVEPVEHAEPTPKASDVTENMDAAAPLVTEPDSSEGPQVGGITIKVKHVKVHRSGEDEKKPRRVREHVSKPEEAGVTEKERALPRVMPDHRSRSVERSHRSGTSVMEGLSRRASSRERTPEKVPRGSRRHSRGEEVAFKSAQPLRGNGGSDVRRSTGETDFRRARDKGSAGEESVDFQAIIRTQRAAWEREREKWRSEIAALQAQVEQLKADKDDAVSSQQKQVVSDETADGLAAPEQSDSPRIHSFPSPKSTGTGGFSESRNSAELPRRLRESPGRSSDGLRVSGGSLHSRSDPLRRSAEGRATPRCVDQPPVVKSTDSNSLPQGIETLLRSVSEQFSRRSADKLRSLAEPLRRSSDGLESSSRRLVLTAEKAVQTGPVEGGEASYLGEENERLRAEVARLREENAQVVRQMEAKRFNSYGEWSL